MEGLLRLILEAYVIGGGVVFYFSEREIELMSHSGTSYQNLSSLGVLIGREERAIL